MSLRQSSGGKGENGAQQFRLLTAYLLLRLEDGIDKFLVRDLTVEMSLGHIIVYLKLGVLKKLLSDPCPDVERRITIVNVSSMNSKQCKLCVNRSRNINVRLLWETTISSNCTQKVV